MVWFILLACNNEGAKTTDGGVWSGGEYDVYTLTAEDACFDGALEVLFMPQGPDTPHPFEYPIYLPDYAELPTSYTIDLREPFVRMPITVSHGDGDQMIGSGQIDDVLLGESTYGDCSATMAIDLSFAPSAPHTAEGSADINIRDLSGADGRCPLPTANPCSVYLTLWAEKR